MRFFVVAATLAVAAGATEIPKGTEFEIRLLSKVSSTESKPKDTIEAVILTPVLVNGSLAIGSGTRIKGEIADVKAPADANDRATMVISFNKFLSRDGKETPVKGRITKIDNSREVVDENGKIVGILASETISAKMDEGLQKLGGQIVEPGRHSQCRQVGGDRHHGRHILLRARHGNDLPRAGGR